MMNGVWVGMGWLMRNVIKSLVAEVGIKVIFAYRYRKKSNC